MVFSFGPALGLSLAPFIKPQSGLYRALRPVANAYANLTGHRAHGLKYDDILVVEREDVQKAIERLPAREAYDRAFRIRVAFQQSVLHKPLPKNQWTKPEDDVRYLTPIIEEVAKEQAERAEWDSLAVERKR
ncbi:Cytochrome b-c1 complex subunit 7, mitochondrial [Cryptotrichosporon argae]